MCILFLLTTKLHKTLIKQTKITRSHYTNISINISKTTKISKRILLILLKQLFIFISFSIISVNFCKNSS